MRKDHFYNGRLSSLLITVQSSSSPTSTNHHRCSANHAPMTESEKEELYVTWLSQSKSSNPFMSTSNLSRLSSTTEACPLSLLAAPKPSTSESPSTSSPLLTSHHPRFSSLTLSGTWALGMASPPHRLPSCLHQPLLPCQPYHRCCYLPQSLHDALGNLRLVFADVQVASDVMNLSEDYGMKVEMKVDLTKLVVKEMNWR